MKQSVWEIPKLLKILFVAVIYFALAVITLPLQSFNATPIWPPAGFAFAMVLFWQRTSLTGIFLGAFSASLYVFLGHDSPLTINKILGAAAIALGNVGAVSVGWYFLNKFLPKTKNEELLLQVHSVFRFILVSLFMCFISSGLGVAINYLLGFVDSSALALAWLTWWTEDIAGILVLTPFILVWFGKKPKWKVEWMKVYETILLVLGLVFIAGVVFLNWFHPKFLFTRAFMITPFLIWVSVRLDLLTLTGLNIIAGIIAMLGTLSGIGPFIAPSLTESLITAEVFITINCIMVLILHAAILERRQKEQSLQLAKENLEAIVWQRTQELQEKNRELEAKNGDLASFSYVASHDLQEPLRKIQTFSDLILQEEQNLSVKQKMMFGKIQSAVSRMTKLIENLLAFSRLDATTSLFAKVNLNELVSEVKQDLTERMQAEDVVMESDVLPNVTVVPFQLQQLFTNLLSNSIKFKKPGGVLHISVRYERIKGLSIQALGASAGDWYHHIAFSDNGIGFEQQYANKIFEIFHRLHGRTEYEGTGIGLAICKKIVENHKGFVTATGDLGKGARFDLYFPVDKAELNENSNLHLVEESIDTSA